MSCGHLSGLFAASTLLHLVRVVAKAAEHCVIGSEVRALYDGRITLAGEEVACADEIDECWLSGQLVAINPDSWSIEWGQGPKTAAKMVSASSAHCTGSSAHVSWLLARAQVALDAGLFHAARRHCQVAVAHVPASAAAYHMLGVTLSRAGQLEEAEGAFTSALELNPSDLTTAVWLGNVLWRQGRLDDAANRSKLALVAGDFSASIDLQRALVGLGREEEAIQILQLFAPQDLAAASALATAFLAQGHMKEAGQVLKDAVGDQHADDFVRLWSRAALGPYDDLCDACGLARLGQQKAGSGIAPVSFLLPQQQRAFDAKIALDVDMRSDTPWEHLRCGREQSRSPSSSKSVLDGPSVARPFVEGPLTFRGKKVELRAILLVTSATPALRLWLSQEYLLATGLSIYVPHAARPAVAVGTGEPVEYDPSDLSESSSAEPLFAMLLAEQRQKIKDNLRWKIDLFQHALSDLPRGRFAHVLKPYRLDFVVQADLSVHLTRVNCDPIAGLGDFSKFVAKGGPWTPEAEGAALSNSFVLLRADDPLMGR